MTLNLFAPNITCAEFFSYYQEFATICNITDMRPAKILCDEIASSEAHNPLYLRVRVSNIEIRSEKEGSLKLWITRQRLARSIGFLT